MGIQLENAARSAGMDAIAALLDAADDPGYVVIREGATVGAGTVLATIPLAKPAFGAAADGVATIDADPVLEDDDPSATGTAGHFEAFDGDDNLILSGDVTATDGGGALELTTLSIAEGVPVRITGGTLTLPAGSVA